MDYLSTHKNLSFLDRLEKEGLPRLVSDLLNPLFMPPILVGITVWLLGSSRLTIGWIVGLALFFYTIVPLAATFHLFKNGKIASLDLVKRESRDRLFLLSIGSAAAAFISFCLIISPMHQLVTIIVLIFLMNSIIGFGINRIWKISIHEAALSTAGAILFYFSQLQTLLPAFSTHILSLSILLLLLPLMIWARYQLKVHSLAELFGGALAGFLLTIIELSLLIKIW